jgi:hypothetical protein
MDVPAAPADVNHHCLLRCHCCRHCCRLVWFVQNVGLLVFSVMWVACFDYMIFMFTCSWTSGGTHVKWTDKSELLLTAALRLS